MLLTFITMIWELTVVILCIAEATEVMLGPGPHLGLSHVSTDAGLQRYGRELLFKKEIQYTVTTPLLPDLPPNDLQVFETISA